MEDHVDIAMAPASGARSLDGTFGPIQEPAMADAKQITAIGNSKTRALIDGAQIVLIMSDDGKSCRCDSE